MKRKYREAMRAARQQFEPDDDDDEDAIEARDWHDDWAAAPAQQDEADKHYRSHQ